MRYSLILFSLVFTGLLSAQTATEVRSAAQSVLAAYDAPGFALGVIKDGETIISEGFGTRTVGKQETIDGNTLFAIASNTKAFISTAIGKLHEEGKLDLDAPVRQYLPYFELYDIYASNHTTVRDLLCHRVGLGTFSGDAIWYKSDKSAEQIVRQIRHLPQAYPWRGGYGYTNLMFITAGEVIRAVTGQPWSEYVRQNFFVPLNMSRSQTSINGLKGMANIATPHISYRSNETVSMAPWEASGAAGGIISSTNDMLKWLNAQLREGTVDGKEIFPADVQNHTFKLHNTTGGKLQLSGVGLGWFIYERNGRAVVTHGGGYDGMYSRVILVPEEELGIVILSNSTTGLTSALGSYLRDLYLGEEVPEDWLEKSVKREMDGRKEWNERQEAIDASRILNTQPTLTTEAMTGKYADPLFGTMEVSSNTDGTLEIRFEGSPRLNAKLTHHHYDTWKINWHEPQAWFDLGTVQFVTNNRHQITGLSFDVPNDDIFFEEIEPKRVE